MIARIETAEIKQRAIRTAIGWGAGAVRVVSTAADAQARERMEAAFARRDFATWGYDARYAQTASDPAALLPGARTMLCVAMPYATEPSRAHAPLRGRVSNYAWSRDYHHELRALLAATAAEIDDAAGASVTAVACDTRPVAERAFAARSGLGWIGKHTNLISPQLGSFVFLGEIVTTLDLPVDEPLRKSCGSCSRCTDACPTQALRGDYTIDATRCISDLTQRTDEIPRAMRPLLGDWIWGCDICQTVCPPNARAATPAAARWAAPDADAARPPLVELLRLGSAAFKRRYRSTAMGWRGAAVLRRNAAVALGNALDRSAVDPLIESVAHDPHPMVRAHAAWALGRIGSPRAVEALHRRSAHEREPSVCEEIRCALEAVR
ncbi:MAG TPA: tRNA epoxyqueuosine(34) reductase QueG [Candidatus Cybelea sp.]|jgi:epoxyqueuosine reductase|nr:tRNA epoxyqueuosine(34) reductase QueG [Candidatus Cybelea sp.]